MLGLVGTAVISNGQAQASSGSADWPGYLFGPAHSSYNAAATSITPSNVGDLEPVWQWLPPASPNSGTTNLLASPTVVNGVVYIGDKDGEFYAINEATHLTIWSAFLGLDTPKGGCGVGDAQGIISTATVMDDPITGTETVYVNAPDGYLYALNAASGAVIWKGLVDTPSATENDYYSWGSPAVANGKVYIGISSDCDNPLVPGGMVAFNQETGAQIASWQALPNGDVGGSIWSSVAVMPDGSVIATTGNGYENSKQPLYDESIVRLDGNTLKLLDYWQVPPSEQVPDSDFGASPTLFSATVNGVSTPMVGACNKNGLYYAFRQDDLNAGPVWQYQMTVPYPGGAEECDSGAIWDGTNLIESGGAPTTINGVTYMGSVRSLNPATGQPIWQTGLSGTIVGSPSEDGAGVVAAPTYQSSDDELGVYLLNATTGAIIGFIPTPHSPLFGQAIFAGNDLLVGAGPGFGLTDYEITTPGKPVTNVAPGTVAAGTNTTVTLTGSGFTGSPSVFVSGGLVVARNIDVVSPTTLKFTAAVKLGANPGARNIAVVEPGSPDTSLTCSSCLTIGSPPAPPVPASASPNSVVAGEAKQAVTLTGTHFEPGAKVTSHSGITVTATYVSSTQLNLSVKVASTATPGPYNLFVSNPDGGFGECANCITVSDPVAAPLSVTAVTPSAVGQQSTFPKMTITGTGFAPGATVTFSASTIDVKAITYVSPTSLLVSVHVPSSATVGPGNVTVTTTGGSASCSGCLTVDAFPDVLKVSTPADAGETVPVTVTGTSFQSGLSVKTDIPGATIGPPTSVSATSFSIEVTVPLNTANGKYSLTVTNPDGGIGTFGRFFVAGGVSG
jgi:polyvinyl alcohol dehydrogenase (cytochrome)